MHPAAIASLLLHFTTTMELNVDHRDLASFKERIQFSSLPVMSPSEGVRANWNELPAVLSAIVKGKRPYHDSVHISQSGLGERETIWRLKEGTLSVEIFVSGEGPAGARQAFIARASSTTMWKIPYERAPVQLGDLAICSPSSPSRVVMWVYRNVFIVLHNDGTSIDVRPAAQAIQRFMEAHRVSRLADQLPFVDQVKVSAREIHIGDEFKVAIVLGKTTPLDSVETDFTSSFDPKTTQPRLAQVSRSPLEVTYKATMAGQATIDVQVMDRKTLLSPPVSITVDVLPAR